MTHYSNTHNPIDFPKKKEIPMLERFAAQSLVEQDGELIFSKEKFAELVVKECMEQLELVRKYRYDRVQPLENQQTIIDECQYQIKQHFGVEE